MHPETFNGSILIIGSIGMGLMTTFVILFIFLYQKKMIRKERAYRDIEKMLRTQELQSAYHLIEGQEKERKRIAQDLHDNVGNLLATLKIFSDLVLKKEQPDSQKELNKKINQITEMVTTEVRKISHSLDSGVVQTYGLRVAIEQLSEVILQGGQHKFEVIYEVIDPLPGDASLHLYRIIQELVTNSLKHSRCSAMRLEVSQVNGELSLIFEDNGVGFKPDQHQDGIGMQNIRSRINHLNGEMKIHSGTTGSSFIIEIPIGK